MPVIARIQEKKEKTSEKDPATNGKTETVPMAIDADLLMKAKAELWKVVPQEEEIAVDTVMTEVP